MKKIVFLFLLSFIFLSVTPIAGNNGKKLLIEKYSTQLEATTNARDSVSILYNLFDLSGRKAQREYAWELYETAGRAADVSTQLDMLRNLSVFYQREDSVINVLQDLAEKIQNPDARAATKTFILNQQVSAKSANPDTEFETVLFDSITHINNGLPKNKYDQIALLYKIIQYLGVDSEGALFKEILDSYATIIDELPSSDYPLKSQLYTTSAIIYSRLNEDGRKSIEFDRKIIELSNLLQQMYIKRNRKYRSYDTNKFICYRRMLSNYRALSPDEVEEIYDSIRVLYNRNPDVKADEDKNGMAAAYYYIAKKDYANALPALKRTLAGDKISIYLRRKTNYLLAEAAKQMGDRETQYEAMENYISLSREIDSLRRASIDREIMVRELIDKTPDLFDVSHVSLSDGRKEKESQGKNLPLTIISSVLAVLLIVYMILYFRLRLKK